SLHRQRGDDRARGLAASELPRRSARVARRPGAGPSQLGMTAALAVFAAAFSLYLGCLYPAIAPRDSSDMASAAMTLGVAHPPGYPLYSVLGRAWLEILP